jgi:AcrR family transcriptional regulator
MSTHEPPAATAKGSSAPVPRRRNATKGEAQKQVILDAFRSLLATSNVSELSVADITNAAGMNRSNFYFYYETKYEALGDLVTDVWDMWIERTGGIPRRSHESVLAYYERLHDAAFSTWLENDAVMIAGLQAMAVDEPLRNRWLALLASHNQELGDQVALDAKVGLAKPTSSDYGGVVSLMTNLMLTTYYNNFLLKTPASDTERMQRNLRAVWLKAVFGMTADEAAQSDLND